METVLKKPVSNRNRRVLHLLLLQFIEERLELLSSGLHTSDEFELEASVYGDRSSSKMKQIISNVKQGSGAIMKNVKNKVRFFFYYLFSFYIKRYSNFKFLIQGFESRM